MSKRVCVCQNRHVKEVSEMGGVQVAGCQRGCNGVVVIISEHKCQSVCYTTKVRIVHYSLCPTYRIPAAGTDGGCD